MINTKLQSIIDTKSAIGNAIVNKGGTITGETPFFNYAAQIDGISTGSVLTGNATANQVFNGQTFYSNDANTQLTGTFVFDGNAAVGNVETGKTFFATNGTKLTGTGLLIQSTGNDINVMNPKIISNIGQTSRVTYDDNFVFQSGAINTGVSSPNIIMKVNKTTLSNLGVTNEYGHSIFAIEQTNDFLYAGGGFGGNNAVKSWHKGNMVYSNEANTYGAIITNIATDGTHIYVGGQFGIGNAAGQVKIWHASNLVFVGQTNSYGGEIRGIVVDNSFIYAAGSNTIKKWHKGNLVYVGATNDYGGAMFGLTVDDNHLYGGGYTDPKIKKWHKGNLAFVSDSVAYPGTIDTLDMDNTFIYCLGQGSSALAKFYKDNLALVNFSTFRGGMGKIRTSNDGFIYVATALGAAVRPTGLAKVFVNTPFVETNGVKYYQGVD